jgi:hypothetical protein
LQLHIFSTNTTHATILLLFKQWNTMSKLILVKALWGVVDLDDASKWRSLFTRIKSEGFDAVETHGVYFSQPEFINALNEASLSLVAQIHTTSIIDKGSKGFFDT